MQLVTAIARGFQAIFAIIVLGISVDLARGQDTSVEKVPASTGYAAFCGGLGVLVSLIGIAALFLSSLEGMVTLALDTLSGLAMLAGGIAYAVLLRNADCSSKTDYETAKNPILSGGCAEFGNTGRLSCTYFDDDKLKSRCVSARADTAFMFISFVTCVGVAAWCFLKGRGKGSVSYA